MGKVYGGNNNGISCDIKAYLGNPSSIANDIKVYMGDSNGIAQEIYNPIPPLADASPRAWIKAYQNSITEEVFSPSDPRIMGGSFIKDIQYTVVNGERRYTKIKIGYTFSSAWTNYMASLGYTGVWEIRYTIKPVSTSQTYHGKVYYGGTYVDTDIHDGSYINGSDNGYRYYSIPGTEYVEITPYSGDYFTIPSGGYIELYIDTVAGA